MPRFFENSRRSKLTRTALSLFSLLLLSCASIPPSQPRTSWLDVLPPLTSDSFYASVNVASSWDLLRLLTEASGTETPELERIIGALDRVHAHIRKAESPTMVPDFFLICVGKLSPGAVASQLNLDPAWERLMLERLPGRGFTSSHWSYRTYWKKGEVEIAVPKRGLLFVTRSGPSTGDPATAVPTAGDPAARAPAAAELMLRRLRSPEAQPFPDPARQKSEASDIFLYLPDPVAIFASSAAVLAAQDPGAFLQELPIRQGWISAQRRVSGGEYELEVVFLLDQVESPRSVERLLRLMLTLWLRKIQVEDPVETLKALTIRVDSQSVRIESLFLDIGDIVSLLTTLIPANLGSQGKL
jgi:hypothetical protein